jgi:hypothetical protein
MTAFRPGASPPPLTTPICAHSFHICTVTESIDKFDGLHELDDVTQDTREEVESEGDSE